MKRSITWILMALAVIVQAAAADTQKKTKVACVGNSITYGFLVQNREKNAYPFQLADMLGKDYEVGNFGRSGATLLRKGHNPYWNNPEYPAALQFKPDILLIHLGVNDTDPRNWPNYNSEFISDYVDLIESFRKENPNVRVIIANLSPLLSKHPRFRSGTLVWRDKARQAIREVAEITGAELIDFGETLRDFPDLMPDGIHPDSAGSRLMAETALAAITGNYGGLKLPAVYSDGMVLQRYKPITVNGTADSGSKITASLGKTNGKMARVHAVADNRGKWSVTFPPMPENEGLEMVVTDGKKTLRFGDVAIGEVWLASGQSNMEFRMRATTTFAADTMMLDDPQLRLFDMKPRVMTDAVEWSDNDKDSLNHHRYYLPTAWKPSTKANASNFSAVAWYFGKMLRDSLKVPVGIICNAIGGSGTESWIDIETIEHGMPEMLVNWRKNDYIQPWVQKRAGENIGNGNHRHPYQPSYLFANGIRPLGAYPVAGVIWYQGESNANNIELHEQMFNLLVQSWRENWKQPELPFIFTQLSSINRPSWQEFRDSQRRMALSIPGTAMAVSSDLGDSLDVHPRNKRPVGQRLARQALNRVYSMTNVTPSGPLPLNAVSTGKGTVVLTMEYADGLKTSDGNAPRTFEIAQYEGMYLPAKAEITPDNRIILTNMDIETPRYVRYGWQPFTRANLVNSDNLPASTFKLPVTEQITCEPWINAGVSAAFAGVADGHVLRAGGCNFPGNPMATDAKKTFYSGIYEITDHHGILLSRLIGQLPEPMAYGATATTPEGMVIVGGTTASKALDTAWLITVGADGKATCSPLPSLPSTVDNCAAAYADVKVYVAGGNVDGKPSNALWCLDMSDLKAGWKALKSFPGNPRVQPVIAASAADGKQRLYLWGGFAGKGDGREASLDTDGLCYTIAGGKWTKLPAPVGSDAQTVSTGGGTAVTLADGRIFVSGGVNKDIFLEALRNQAPDYLSHPVEWYRFNDLGLIYSPADGKWSIHSQGPEMARAGAAATVAPDGAVVILGGEIKPRIRTADALRIVVE